jgi:hypothetical protein
MFDPAPQRQLDRRSLEIEPSGAKSGHCDCCASATNRVWGFINRREQTIAAYFVGWTAQQPDHGASFDLILGRWGGSAASQDRYVVALDYRIVDASGQFMVVDAEGRLPSGSDLAGSALKRSEVIGTPLAPQVFALVDAIVLGDQRLGELREWEH